MVYLYQHIRCSLIDSAVGTLPDLPAAVNTDLPKLLFLPFQCYPILVLFLSQRKVSRFSFLLSFPAFNCEFFFW